MSCLSVPNTQILINVGFYAKAASNNNSNFCANPTPNFAADCITDAGGDRWGMAALCNTFSSCSIRQTAYSVTSCNSVVARGNGYAYVDYACMPSKLRCGAVLMS